MSFGFGKLADPLHEGERFSEIAKSKRALDAVGIIAQFPIRRLTLETQGFITRKRRDAAATRRAGFFCKGLGHVAVSNSLTNAMADGQRSISPNTMSSEPVIAETSASMCPRLKKIHRLKMGERRRPDLALVRPVAAVRHQTRPWAPRPLRRPPWGVLLHLRARRTRSV